MSQENSTMSSMEIFREVLRSNLISCMEQIRQYCNSNFAPHRAELFEMLHETYKKASELNDLIFEHIPIKDKYRLYYEAYEEESFYHHYYTVGKLATILPSKRNTYYQDHKDMLLQ